jgi:hypothetical protein
MESFPYQNNKYELTLLSSSSSSSSSSLLLSKSVNHQLFCAGEKRGNTQRTKQGKTRENMKLESIEK